jgi:hypothetical protein
VEPGLAGESEVKRAEQTLFHDPERPSQVWLPLLLA